MKQLCCFSLLVLFLFDASSGAHDLGDEYRFTADLAGDDYVLHWNVDMENELITFGVNASTTGWVGFGISPTGQMPGSDVVIAWVDSSGQVFFQVSNGRYFCSFLKFRKKTSNSCASHNNLIHRIDMPQGVFCHQLTRVKIGYSSVERRVMEGQFWSSAGHSYPVMSRRT